MRILANPSSGHPQGNDLECPELEPGDRNDVQGRASWQATMKWWNTWFGRYECGCGRVAAFRFVIRGDPHGMESGRCHCSSGVGKDPGLHSWPSSLLFQFGVKFVTTFRTDPMGKLSLGMLLDEHLDLAPIPLIVTDLLARGADREQSAQFLDL